jgi:hypothetical protein
MATITIDGKEYDSDALSDEAKAHIASLQFCEMELKRLQAQAASFQTAQMQYANALKVELEKSVQGSVAKKPVTQASDSSASADKNKKKGLLGGLFGKK